MYAYEVSTPWEMRDAVEDSQIVDGVKHLLCGEEIDYLESLYADERAEAQSKFAEYLRFWKTAHEVQQQMLQRLLVYCPSSSKTSGKHVVDFVGPYEIIEVVSESLRKLDVLNKGGHSVRDISAVQHVNNLVPYFRREEGAVDSWLQCDRCDEWIKVDEVTMKRFAAPSARFFCRLVGRECRRASDD
ncbi:hypothetical protein FOZ63_013067 [Perkinsus olseni]|uniref:Uncharacterized protein n=1 Tax=Perkinsus olseni TaxID=32597 RepID=A0A7J6NIF3_PEROL|nr:hypothetical protein FOZ63_013067 [Perkinsus olseni]